MPKDVNRPKITKFKRRRNSSNSKRKRHRSSLLNRKKSKKGNVSLKDGNASELPGWKKSKDSVTPKMNKNALKNNRKLMRLECVKRNYFKIKKLYSKRKKKRPKSKDRILSKGDCMNSRLEPKKLQKRPNKSSKLNSKTNNLFRKPRTIFSTNRNWQMSDLENLNMIRKLRCDKLGKRWRRRPSIGKIYLSKMLTWRNNENIALKIKFKRRSKRSNNRLVNSGETEES